MKEYYDFSRHQYGIAFKINDVIIDSMHIINNTSYDLNDKLDYVSEKLSISYDPVSGDVIDREVSKPSPSHLSKYAIKRCYVRNVFTELHDIYLRKKHGLYDSCMHVRTITQAAIKCLQDQVSIWEERLKCSRLDLHFVFTLPTSWDYEMQNNLIRPLFIQAGLINEKDHNDRLLFFSKLDLAYQSIKYYYQECHDHMKLKIGKQYAICSLDYDDGVSVDLELFSVRYPLSTATDNEYVPLSLKSVSFTLPFDLDINYARLERLFEKRCNAIVTPEFIDIMKLQTDVDKLVEDNTNEDGFNLMREKFMNIDFQMFLNYQPFEELEDLIYGNFNLSQTEIENIESITVTDMYEELSHCVKIDFMNQISDLLTDTDEIVELPPLTDPVPGIYTTLEKDINGFTEIYIIDFDDWVSHNPIILDIKRVNYNNTLQILFRWLGYCDEIRASARGNLMVKEDPLTLAYI